MRGKQDNLTSCLVISLLCLSFVIGGMVGGIFGGGLILWATSPTPMIQAPAVLPSPTPISFATSTPTPAITPTPTRVVIPTLSTEDIVEQVIPSVVTVVNIQKDYGYLDGKNNRRVVGSGIVIDEQGYVVTNAHVVDATKKLSVILSTGEEVSANLITYEPEKDLAMLKLTADNLIAATWGDSNQVRLGQPVMAIGSALGDFPNSVTMGIVSGLNRALALNDVVVYGLIQTDAAINQGNSGGPLVNLKGEVVGINTFIIREDHDQGVAQGIGFAIPATSAKMLTSAWITQNNQDLQVTNQEQELTAPQPLPAAQPSDNK